MVKEYIDDKTLSTNELFIEYLSGPKKDSEDLCEISIRSGLHMVPIPQLCSAIACLNLAVINRAESEGYCYSTRFQESLKMALETVLKPIKDMSFSISLDNLEDISAKLLDKAKEPSKFIEYGVYAGCVLTIYSACLLSKIPTGKLPKKVFTNYLEKISSTNNMLADLLNQAKNEIAK